MALPVSFRWDDELVRRVDEARGDVPRSVWVRRAVERALETSRPGVGEAQAGVRFPPPAPAEQPGVDPGLAIEVLRQAERDFPPRVFRPYPKGGKR